MSRYMKQMTQKQHIQGVCKKMEIIKRSGLLISRQYENQEFYQKIKDHLSRRTQAYQTSNYIVNNFYLESEKF